MLYLIATETAVEAGPTGVGAVVIAGFLGGLLIGLLASALLRMFGAPVEAMSQVIEHREV